MVCRYHTPIIYPSQFMLRFIQQMIFKVIGNRGSRESVLFPTYPGPSSSSPCWRSSSNFPTQPLSIAVFIGILILVSPLLIQATKILTPSRSLLPSRNPPPVLLQLFTFHFTARAESSNRQTRFAEGYNFPFFEQKLAMDMANQKNQSKKRRKPQSSEGQFMYKLDTCSKKNDLSGALTLYEKAVSENLHLSHNHYDTLLYLCTNSLNLETPDLSKDFAIEKGFYIYDQMLANNINPTEATITAVARLASAKGDGDFAFELVKSMGKYKILPRLRTYDPALFSFCQNSEAEKAYMVEDHMSSMGVVLEEPELAVLMKVSADVGREEKVYSYLHRLRNSVRCVKASSAEIIEGWFCSKMASEVGNSFLDESIIKDIILKKGGGWHGQGWLGKGKWDVSKSNITSEGCCLSCGDRLACVDIDRMETETFAESIASLATKREAKSDFRVFQEWKRFCGRTEEKTTATGEKMVYINC